MLKTPNRQCIQRLRMHMYIISKTFYHSVNILQEKFDTHSPQIHNGTHCQIKILFL